MAKSIAVITIVDDEGEMTVDAVYDAESFSGQVCKIIMDKVQLARTLAGIDCGEDDDAV